MSDLLIFYNASRNALFDGNISVVPSGVYEAAFHGMTPYLLLIAAIAVIIYIKNQNLGLLGIVVGSLAAVLAHWGKLPATLQMIPYVILAISIALTIFLVFTERDYS